MTAQKQAEAQDIEAVNEMCIESLSPDLFEKWEEVQKQLKINRHLSPVRTPTVSELQAILHKMDYYKLSTGFIGTASEACQPDFYEHQQTFPGWQGSPVTRGEVLKMIYEA